MNTPDWSKLADKFQDEASETMSKAAEQLKELAGRLPEIVYPSVAEAAAAHRQRCQANLAYYHQRPEEGTQRLGELEEEWDTARVLKVVGSALSIAGFWCSLTRNRLWLLLPLVVAAGSLHHGLTGQSPAEDWVRRLGFRTRDEIEEERRGLESLLGIGSGASDAEGNISGESRHDEERHSRAHETQD